MFKYQYSMQPLVLYLYYIAYFKLTYTVTPLWIDCQMWVIGQLGPMTNSPWPNNKLDPL